MINESFQEKKILKEKKKVNFWTIEEDNKLIEAIKLHGTSNWSQIAIYIGSSRTRGQCSQRWNRDLNPSIKREKWTSEEDKILLHLVELYGLKSWTRISKEIGTRSDVQCRFHYNLLMSTKKESIIETRFDNVFGQLIEELDNISFLPFTWD